MTAAKVVLVLGGSGTIGSGVIKALLKSEKGLSQLICCAVYGCAVSSQDCDDGEECGEITRHERKIWKYA